jgi:Calx-beta domain-containing protein
MTPLLALFAAVAAVTVEARPADQAARPVAEVLGGGCQQLLKDGGLELGSPNPHWSQTSTSFPIICEPFGCGNGGGTAGPHGGSWWARFGASPVPTQGSLSQSFTRPASGTAWLRFHLWIGARSGNGNDVLRAVIDGQPVFTVTEADAGYGTYALAETFLAVGTAAGSHTLRFESSTFGPAVTNFSVDDVSIEWCPLPSLAVADGSRAEADTGAAPLTFGVSLTPQALHTVTVAWATRAPASGAAATPGADYQAASGVLTFEPGATQRTVAVQVLGDTLDEFDESFALALGTPVGATASDPEGIGSIVDDDPLPSVSLGDVTIVEGDAGASQAQFAISLTPASGRPVTGTFTTADGSAVAGADYTAVSAPIALAPGATTVTVSVPVQGDAIDEIDETFTGALGGVAFATVADGQGQATIDDDDGPAVRIADRAVGEPDTGSASAVFEVTLSAPSPQRVTVTFATADATAVAGNDYAATTGTVTFGPGTMERAVAVPVLGDADDEPNETFQVLLGSVEDATLEDAAATGFIVDNDGAALPLLGDLAHGTLRHESLAASPGAARHLYLLARPPRTSWEVVVDAASGDVGVGDGPSLARLSVDLSPLLQPSLPVGAGRARRLPVVNDTGSTATDYVEVKSAGCATDCGGDDVYRLRVRETTLAGPRFNNTGGQATVVIVQERAGATVQGTLWFWSAGGTLLASHPFGLLPRESLVLNSAAVPGLADQGGTLTLTHDGPYGGLAGKAVALDPAAGFSFDTPLEARRR